MNGLANALGLDLSWSLRLSSGGILMLPGREIGRETGLQSSPKTSCDVCCFRIVDVAWLKDLADCANATQPQFRLAGCSLSFIHSFIHCWRSAGFSACQSWDLVLAILEMMQQVPGTCDMNRCD